MGGYRKYKKKPDNKLSTRKLAAKAMRAVNKLEADTETKWVDTTFVKNTDGALADCEPFTSTTTGNSVLPLTLVEPRQSDNTFVGASIPTINTSNYRDGARIYVSGLYLKAQFFWPQIRTITTQRYPPYANISWAVVREIKNKAAVAAYTDAEYPKPSDVWQVPDSQLAAPILWDQDQAPLASLLFKNMNNGHNYKILREGSFCLAAPTSTQQGPRYVTVEAADSVATESSFGSRVTTGQTNPHQFSNNSVKTLNIKIHPKVKVRYRQLPEGADNQTAVTDELTTPLENGMYFMFWCDTGNNNADSRWYSPDTGTYTFIRPRLILNERLRFKDS